MGRLCSVINCSTRNSKVTPERITLFSLPKDDYLKSQWINVVCAVNNRETNVKFVCAKHFKTEDIKRTYYGSENLGSEVNNADVE
ncbi:unnamed protein product [Macrosiphum euphorbiae]|uniref:THAP-type domain-containing protein n=1 Tax=Macrosiphum euphorbiae TaxID=13131 RepID=A0AAV0XRE6_9HEMI|nr:unnamed protein product [Macrosiphum euphorbiae]